MKRKLSAALGAAILSMALLAGCSQNSSQKSEAAISSSSSDIVKESEKRAVNKDWPDSTVYVYVPAKAGGGSDTITRIYTAFFEKYTGKTFSVVNDPTGNGAVVYENISNGDPGGLDLMLGANSAYVSYFNGQVSAPMNDRNAFTLLGMLACPVEESSSVLIVRKDAPYNTLDEYVAYAKEHPGEILFGLQNGGGSQYVAVLMDNTLGIQEKYVEAGSVADKLVSLVGGNIDACVVYPKQAVQYIETGDVKAIACLGEIRSSILPDVPTVTEFGYGTVDLLQYQALFGPPDMDEGIVNAINEMVKAANKDPDVISALEKQGVSANAMSIEEAYEIFDREYEIYNEVTDMIKVD